ncbi:transposase [Streptomyces sp. MUSC 125]|uniref:DDE-type integrase/transposase/recombinase n=1 Tax=unclassified Streptomyces TaxID=2593676 RepID=UPI00057DC5DA|nr:MULTISPECIES: DDE-type integrase/transposase/recombinase [unclassified Streptomyces]KIE24258.1 transposase [Streptomyces sp. MUSC 125]MCH0557007.1 DDE-type integrase/transposase/recombinase [Streptomyces sp. MUM 16J]
MSRAGVRVGVGTSFQYDGETVEVVEMAATTAGNEVVLKDGRGRLLRLSLKELLFSDRAVINPDGPGPSADDEGEIASVVLGQLDEAERREILERAEHVRELLTGYRSGSPDLAREGEPRDEYAPSTSLEARYAAKAAELGVSSRSVRRWVTAFRAQGEVGLAPSQVSPRKSQIAVDDRWVETAVEVMVEHADQSRPSRTMVIERTRARVIARFGEGVVPQPSRATAFRLLEELERRHPLFRLSTKRNRDIAGRPEGPYGKLRPMRPGEYLLMDSTRLDVFAFDPLMLKWVQAELSVGMDWYTRCITGIRLTPVSTKAVDVSAVLFQSFRPRPAGRDWPRHAIWPEHGIPRTVLVDVEGATGPGLASPPLVPETLVVDHGKVYVSEHLTSVCRRMGISIQPARLRTGRDKGPVERYFRTLRESLLQVLPGYKGPDIHSRGESPEDDAFFFLDELEAIIREWTATVYHCRPHSSLVDPGLPGLRMSPAKMFEHGMARAGYIEVPRDRDLAFEFLKTEWRTIQHYGVEIGRRRYSGPGLPQPGIRSPYDGPTKNSWPFQVDPDDITRIYFRDFDTRVWHTLTWEHAPSARMPLSEDALTFARQLAASKYRFPDDRLAVADLLERWNLGLGTTIAERRMALRLSREQAAIGLPADEAETVVSLPSVRKALGQDEETAEPQEPDVVAEAGDDDEADLEDLAEENDFYADALEDV